MIESDSIKVLIHAPTPEALKRARQNALNLLRARPDAQVRIMLSGPAVSAALESDPHELDPLTWLCPNTLANIGEQVRAPMQVMKEAAILLVARLQQNGWAYVRA